MNLHGRIWIGNLILFGLGGVLIVHVLNPLLFPLFDRMSSRVKEIVTIVLCAIFLGDYAITHFVLKLVKNSVEHSEADNTEAINKEVCLMLQDRSVFHRRFADAYPEVVYRTERINARMEAIRAETERLRKEAELRAEEMGARISENREQLAAILDEIPVPGIVRNRRKILAAIQNAKAFLQIQKEYGSFDAYLWHFTDSQVVKEPYYLRTTSPLSDEISKDLKQRGMKFVGSTIIYSYLQACGIYNAHGEECDLYE